MYKTIDFVNKNNEILFQWEQWNKEHESVPNFAPDGIMYRGEFYNGDGYCERFENPSLENMMWKDAPLRYLFITKDQNANGDNAWDVRGETAIKVKGSTTIPSLLHRNLVHLLFGLHKLSMGVFFDYSDISNEDALHAFFYDVALARINVKKQAGGPQLPNPILQYYLERDKKFISAQIQNLDADVLVCCGYSDSVEKTGNLILNFLNENGYHFTKYNDWIYYDESKNKLAVNAWHLSYRKVSSKDFYTDMMSAYSEFLKAYPQFIVTHR